MAKWIIAEAGTDCTRVVRNCNTLIEAEMVLTDIEAEDKQMGMYKDDFYEIVYDGVKYADLCTTAKITCMSEFLDKIVPYDWDDINEGDVADLEDNILYTIGSQFWFDEDGFWYDESIGRL